MTQNHLEDQTFGWYMGMHVLVLVSTLASGGPPACPCKVHSKAVESSSAHPFLGCQTGVLVVGLRHVAYWGSCHSPASVLGLGKQASAGADHTYMGPCYVARDAYPMPSGRIASAGSDKDDARLEHDVVALAGGVECVVEFDSDDHPAAPIDAAVSDAESYVHYSLCLEGRRLVVVSTLARTCQDRTSQPSRAMLVPCGMGKEFHRCYCSHVALSRHEVGLSTA